MRHPLFARMWLRAAAKGRFRAEDQYRRRLLDGLTGRVIEVGAGSGLNFPFYPAAVEQVLAIEPEPRLRAAAVQSAAEVPVPIEVVDGVAARLPADDESFDAGVASLVLCSVPDQDRAIAELHRVIRRGGELRYYEHVVADPPVQALLMRLADAVWPRVAGGCHLSRDTGAALGRGGFVIERDVRFLFTPGGLVPAVPHILGTARRE